MKNSTLKEECSGLLASADQLEVRLPPKQYIAVSLGTLGWSVEDIAENQNTTISAVRQTLRRAEAKIDQSVPRGDLARVYYG